MELLFVTNLLVELLKLGTAGRHREVQKWSENVVFCTCSLPNLLRATTACTFSTAGRHGEVQKWSEHVVPCTCSLPKVLRATAARTFSTSHLPKVVRACPSMVCFVQRRALFRHLNCQKCSGPEVPCTFSCPNVLRARTACTFSTSQLPKVVRS